ncbi:hypothetical protein HanXRQr2_Chr14g0623711 [Helianthus annuus]|uniref:Uncharacterized protein n=1 Tax=Helianthus annuus TaxID=4232 RepID=A0A251SFG1_HELAN|nr:hypothetical protein HanXRQr2_Chr14g0623711 [Helianthus annuus]KAJ0484292.1 hypothetical protein HanHA89_Chr14g0542511 [Helianthus annuus]KAJ0838755.1 hypothetical protein HanPSC8_Chr14g0598551 [Helianthus annuus]
MSLVYCLLLTLCRVVFILPFLFLIRCLYVIFHAHFKGLMIFSLVPVLTSSTLELKYI